MVCGTLAFKLYNLGIAYDDLGDKSKARELLERVLPIWTRAYGSEHPHTMMCEKELAEL